MYRMSIKCKIPYREKLNKKAKLRYLEKIKIINEFDPNFFTDTPQLGNSGLTEHFEFSTRNNDFVVAFMCIQLINTMYITAPELFPVNVTNIKRTP